MATGDSVWPRRSEKDLIARIFSVKRPIYAKQNDDPPLSQKAIITFLSVSQSQTANFTNKRNQKIRKSIHDRYTVIPDQQQCSLLKLLFGKRVLRFKFLLDRYLRYSCM